jgi:TusA-related sulfurtransferase
VISFRYREKTCPDEEVNMTVDKDINVCGKACPFPLITLAREVGIMRKGQLMRITGNDPIFEVSILDFCREGNYEVMENCREGKKVSIVFKI